VKKGKSGHNQTDPPPLLLCVLCVGYKPARDDNACACVIDAARGAHSSHAFRHRYEQGPHARVSRSAVFGDARAHQADRGQGAAEVEAPEPVKDSQKLPRQWMRRGTAESRFSLCSGRCSVSGRLYLLNTSSIGGTLVISGSNAPAGSMTREAALLLFNLVHVTVSTICRISFVCAQARIETE
jgi:hypothetical protein